LDDAPAVDLVVPLEREETIRAGDGKPVVVTEGFVLATNAWVKGLAHHPDGWRVVESVDVSTDGDRTDALLACEAAVEDAGLPGDRADGT